MKLKNIAYLLIGFLLIVACDDDNNRRDFTYDAEKYAEIDEELLIDYLTSHYLNENTGEIEEVANGETPLLNEVETETVIIDDVTYNYYYKILNEGEGMQATVYDSVLVSYKGMLLDNSAFDDRDAYTWFDLTAGVVKGFKYGVNKLKEGVYNYDSVNEMFNYTNSGLGYVFFPSGLGYKNVPQAVVPANSPLVFKIELHQIEITDHDGDGILTKNEDANNDGDVTNDDSDEDGIPDYLDNDNE